MEFLCLANSRKPPARCVAGLDLATGMWLRPVSDENNGGLSVNQALIQVDGRLRGIQPLDVVEFDKSQSLPGVGQPENVARGQGEWVYKRRLFTSELVGLFESNPYLLQDRYDRVLEQNSQQVKSSLCLVSVMDPEFKLNPSNRDQLRAHFKFRNHEFNLAVTDDSTWVNQAKIDARRFSQGRWAFTVSLGTPFNGSLFKLVAWAHQY